MTFLSLHKLTERVSLTVTPQPLKVEIDQKEDFEVFVADPDRGGYHAEEARNFSEHFNRARRIVSDEAEEESDADTNDKYDEAALDACIHLVFDRLTVSTYASRQGSESELTVKNLEKNQSSAAEIMSAPILPDYQLTQLGFQTFQTERCAVRKANVELRDVSVLSAQNSTSLTRIGKTIDGEVSSEGAEIRVVAVLQQSLSLKGIENLIPLTLPQTEDNASNQGERLAIDDKAFNVERNPSIPAKGMEAASLRSTSLNEVVTQSFIPLTNVNPLGRRQTLTHDNANEENSHLLEQKVTSAEWSIALRNVEHPPIQISLKSGNRDANSDKVDASQPMLLESVQEEGEVLDFKPADQLEKELKKPVRTSEQALETASEAASGLGEIKISGASKVSLSDRREAESEPDLEQEVPTKETHHSNSSAEVVSAKGGDLVQGFVRTPAESVDVRIDPKQQITQAILETKGSLLHKEIKTLSITLNPEALGQVNVELISDEAGKIHVNLAVMKSETLEALQQDFAQLKSILNEIGIDEGNVSLHLSSGNEDHQHQKAEYIEWEERESLLIRQSSNQSSIITVEKTPIYPERKTLKRLDIKA